MKIKHQMVHKFTGEVTVNGTIYSPDCIVESLDDKIEVTLRFDENYKIGTADNFLLENSVLFADLDIDTNAEIVDRAYIVPQFELIDPLYNENITQEEYFKEPVKRVKVLSLGCVSNPEIKDLDRLQVIKEVII